MTTKHKIGYKLHCFFNYLWRKTGLGIFEYLNNYFAKWWIDDYLER